MSALIKRPAPSPNSAIEATCPTSCIYKGGGCFVETGFTQHAMRALNESAKSMSALDVTTIEAAALDVYSQNGVPQDGALGGRDLRLHVGGEVGGGETGARLLGAAAGRWRERGGGAVWTYTHRWRDIARAAFGSISVLASVEHLDDLGLALERGYAPSVTVPSFESRKAFKLGGVKVIPCPAETRKTTCVECRLCLDRDLVKMRAGIGFALHGAGAKMARTRLKVVQG